MALVRARTVVVTIMVVVLVWQVLWIRGLMNASRLEKDLSDERSRRESAERDVGEARLLESQVRDAATREAQATAEVSKLKLELSRLRDSEKEIGKLTEEVNRLRGAPKASAVLDGAYGTGRRPRKLDPEEEFQYYKEVFAVGMDETRREMVEMDIHLVYQWYPCSSSEIVYRGYEIDGCLQMNLLNPYVRRVHLLLDSKLGISDFSLFLGKEKLVLHYNGPNRVTASELLAYANENVPEGSPVVLLNADIFFDDTIANLHALSKKPSSELHSYFLSRRRSFPRRDDVMNYDVDKRGHMRDHCNDMYGGSHDVFVFRTPIPAKLIQDSNYEIGTVGFENRFLFDASAAGYKVTNPCRVINAWHLHGDYGTPSGPKPPSAQGRLNIGKSKTAPPTATL